MSGQNGKNNLYFMQCAHGIFSLFIRVIREKWADRTGGRKCTISGLVQFVFLNTTVTAISAKLE